MASNDCQEWLEYARRDIDVLCQQWNIKFSSVRLAKHCAFLTPFAVVVRYPKHTVLLDSVQSERGINSTKRVYNFVCERLGLGKPFYYDK